MPVSHACASDLTSPDEQVPGLLEVLAQVPDPRRRRGQRFELVFVLSVAVVSVLAGAKNFREIGDQAADLPQELLSRLGGTPHPLWRKIIVPSEKRIRTSGFGGSRRSCSWLGWANLGGPPGRGRGAGRAWRRQRPGGSGRGWASWR